MKSSLLQVTQYRPRIAHCFTLAVFAVPVSMYCAGIVDDNKSIDYLDSKTKASLGTLRGHTSEVITIKFVPWNENWVASSAKDNTVRLWDLATGAELVCFPYKFPVLSISFGMDLRCSEQCEFMVTKSGEKQSWSIFRHNLLTQETVYEIELNYIPPKVCVCFEGQVVVTQDRVGFRAYNASSGAVAEDTLRELNRSVEDVFEHNISRVLRNCAGNDSILAVGVRTVKLMKSTCNFMTNIAKCTIAVLRLTSMASVECQHWVTEEIKIDIRTMALSGDGSKLFCGSNNYDGPLIMLDTATMSLLKVMKQHQTCFGVLAVSTTGHEVGYSSDHFFEFYDVENERGGMSSIYGMHGVQYSTATYHILM